MPEIFTFQIWFGRSKPARLVSQPTIEIADGHDLQKDLPVFLLGLLIYQYGDICCTPGSKSIAYWIQLVLVCHPS